MIDEVRLYNRALTDAEIQTDMAAPVADQTDPTDPADTELPAISLDSIPASATYTSAQTVSIDANASANEGVARVEFYKDSELVETDEAAPYSCPWSISSADNGTHSWTAKAYDNAGNVGTSDAISLTVDILLPDTTPPTVSLATTPAGPTYTEARSVSIDADATDKEGVSRVEFFDGDRLLGTDSVFSLQLHLDHQQRRQRRAMSWTARAYDDGGQRNHFEQPYPHGRHRLRTPCGAGRLLWVRGVRRKCGQGHLGQRQRRAHRRGGPNDGTIRRRLVLRR